MRKKSNLKEQFLDVKVFWSPVVGKEPIEEKARAVSSQNPVGDFDILPSHINFITLIFNTLTIHLPQKKINYKFNRGVLEVSQNRVNVFLGL